MKTWFSGFYKVLFIVMKHLLKLLFFFGRIVTTMLKRQFHYTRTQFPFVEFMKARSWFHRTLKIKSNHQWHMLLSTWSKLKNWYGHKKFNSKGRNFAILGEWSSNGRGSGWFQAWNQQWDHLFKDLHDLVTLTKKSKWKYANSVAKRITQPEIF